VDTVPGDAVEGRTTTNDGGIDVAELPEVFLEVTDSPRSPDEYDRINAEEV